MAGGSDRFREHTSRLCVIQLGDGGSWRGQQGFKRGKPRFLTRTSWRFQGLQPPTYLDRPKNYVAHIAPSLNTLDTDEQRDP